jgi:hypothetical protein
MATGAEAVREAGAYITQSYINCAGTNCERYHPIKKEGQLLV